MNPDSWITISVIIGAMVLFATEWISIDLTAMLILLALSVTGVISVDEALSGFGNQATITVAFMFIISAALLKTGALQHFAQRISHLFRRSFKLGMLTLMAMIAVFSAFINNTPVVAVFIPVIMQIAKASGRSASKMLIPLSYASILGGSCTLLGTSTNILVSGIAEKNGVEGFDIFLMTPMGLILFVLGSIYLVLVGFKLLPKSRENNQLPQQFALRDYVSEIQLLDNALSAEKISIMDSELVKELELDIIEVRRNGSVFSLPPGDFNLQTNDILKVRCDLDKIKRLKDKIKVLDNAPYTIGEEDLNRNNTTLVELVITANSDFHGKTLKDIDFRRQFRAIPLAIKHREEIVHDELYNVPLKSGDTLLAEVKTHFIKELKKRESDPESPYILLSEDTVIDFNKKKFYAVLGVITVLVLTAALHILPISIAAVGAVCTLVLGRILNMKDAYDAINWKIIFLLAGALTLGQAMHNSGLDVLLGTELVNLLGQFGPIIVLSGLYLTTSILTELMSNNATAALLAPIAITTATQLDVSPIPFLLAVTFAASASFMTPIGYQTNTMVYSAGNYKFTDFTKVGVWLNLLFWLAATLCIPLIYPF